MNYISNRNFGCRITEIMLKGCRSLIIENNLLYILLLLDKGGDIVSFTYKKTDTDVLWRSPNGLDLLNQQIPNELKYVGGWFECFPNTGELCELPEGKIPQYGDVRYLPWEYTVLRDDENCVCVKLFVRSNVLPFALEKTLTLNNNESVLNFEEKATNFSQHEMPLTWGQHPNIGEPFLNENCVISLPEGELWERKHDESGVLTDKSVGVWPNYEYNGKLFDMSRVPPRDKKIHTVVIMKNLKGNRASVRDTKTGMEVFFEWDPIVFKHMLIWHAFQSDYWNSMFGYHRLICFLFNSSDYGCIKDCMDFGTHISVPPGNSVSTWFRMGITISWEE